LAENVFLWSTTASDNATADPAVPWVENMLPGAVNNVSRAEMAAIARWRDDLSGNVTAAGSTNAYTATSKSGHTAYADDIQITIKAAFTNTGAATLNLNTYGAKAIKVFTGGAEADVAAGQIISGGRYMFVYDVALAGAVGGWVLLNPSPDPTKLPQVGDIKIWTTETLPAGSWLWCNGDAVSRTTYADLFTQIGETFGAGNGSTTFNVPDMRGRAPFGTNGMATVGAGRVTSGGSGINGDVIGSAGGTETHTLTLAQSPAHTHAGTTSDQSQVHTHSGTTSSDGAHTHSYDKPDTGTVFDAGGANGARHTFTSTSTSSNGAHTHTITTGTESANHNHTYTTDSKGGGGAHNNMPPALIVNFVIRFAG
jgi:microcystin-dependent protein